MRRTRHRDSNVIILMISTNSVFIPHTNESPESCSVYCSSRIRKVNIGAKCNNERGDEAKELGGEQELGLLVVQDGQELHLGHVLRVDQPPEVADHPHPRGPDMELRLGLNMLFASLSPYDAVLSV